jgi:hypothetical protein
MIENKKSAHKKSVASKKKSLLESYFPGNRNSFGQIQRAWVVFADENKIFWLRWLRPGFRHCFVVLNDGEHWLALEPLHSCLEVTVLPSPPDFNLPVWLRGQGHHVVEAALQRDMTCMAPIALLNCVEVVKRFLGLRRLFILTPYQLFHHLERQLKFAQFTENKGVLHG